MEVNDYIAKMQKIHQILIDFIENEDTSENESLISRFTFIDNLPKDEKPAIFKETLLTLSHISNYHYRSSTTKSQIKQILLYFQDQIKQTFSNREIFNIFRNNKQILLFLFDQHIITVDHSICRILSKYGDYFSIETNSFCGLKTQDDQELKKKREIGENDNYICQIIRDDLIVDFVKYVSQTNIPLEGQIQPSVFESNPFLIDKKDTSLIEYAAFFGSIQIFKYLQINNVEVNESTMKCAIHGKNSEMISIIESAIGPIDTDDEIKIYIEEAIRCHHNEIADYFFVNLKDQDDDIKKNYLPEKIIQSYNFQYWNEDEDWSHLTGQLVENNYVAIVKPFLHKFEAVIDDLLDSYKRKKTFMQLAIENENIEIVDYLANIIHAKTFDITNKNQYMESYYTTKSLLYLAVECGNAEMVKVLLKNGCNLKQNKTIFYIAEYYRVDFFTEKYTENVEANSDKFINVEEIKNPLIKAVEDEDKDIIELLVNDENTDVNEMSCILYSFYLSEADSFDYYKEKKTALSIAVEKGDVEIVKLLLNNPNIDVDIRLKKRLIDVEKYRSEDFDGHFRYNPYGCKKSDYTKRFSAVDIAKEKGYQQIYQLLLNKSKKIST